jgi:hypothetical protein
MDLKRIIENESFIVCRPLSSNDFISFCKARGVDVDRNRLEQLEHLQLFYPIARIRSTKHKVKIRDVEPGRYEKLGFLTEGELWNGKTIEEYGWFFWHKSFAKDWLHEGLLWNPRSRPFEAWDTFRDSDSRDHTESYYSQFQILPLYYLLQPLTMKLEVEGWIGRDEAAVKRFADDVAKWGQGIIEAHKGSRGKGEEAAEICQVIANRYFFETQTDQRSIRLSLSSEYHDWDWYEYAASWNAQAASEVLNVSVEQMERFRDSLSACARHIDPIEQWRNLISFVAVEKRKQLKGHALLAESFYEMEKVLQLFHDELMRKNATENLETAKKIPVLQTLEFTINQYNLNPRPKLLLVIEGESEEQGILYLTENLFGISLSKSGIELRNIKGIGKAEGLRHLIDDYHHRQTLVFFLSDNEGEVARFKKTISSQKSTFSEERTITSDKNFHLWDLNIEFDNFSYEEIAHAMTEQSSSRYTFAKAEIEECRRAKTKNKKDPLSQLYYEKLNYHLNKPKLFKKLCEIIVLNRNEELPKDGKVKRPFVKVLIDILNLAQLNHQPIDRELWEQNQKSGYLGNPLRKDNSQKIL